MERHIAIYTRVSSKQQDTKSQLPDLERWAAAYAADVPIRWYKDTFSGKTMDRPGWNKLEKAALAGQVSKIVCWRLDRLGRTARGLATLFASLQESKVGLLSLREGIDLGTPAGRLMAHVLASVAQYETEVRAERVRAGQAVARAAGIRWGGSKSGRRVRVSADKERIIHSMHKDGATISSIARTVGLSRPTIYTVIQ